ncbi:hypothetical protein ACYULU_02105 [Breznakiellaceae bacterium SP9]
MKKTTKSRIGGAIAALAVRAAVAKKIVAGAGIVAMGASLVACPTETSEPPAPINPEAELQAAIEWINKPERQAALFSDPGTRVPLSTAFTNPTTLQQVKDIYIDAVKEYQKTKNDKFDPIIKDELKKTGINRNRVQYIISKIATASKVRGA